MKRTRLTPIIYLIIFNPKNGKNESSKRLNLHHWEKIEELRLRLGQNFDEENELHSQVTRYKESYNCPHITSQSLKVHMKTHFFRNTSVTTKPKAAR